MALVNGSTEYYKYLEKAEKIYRKSANARNCDESAYWRERGENLADGMRDKFGHDDECVEYIIERFYLERL